MPGRMRDFSACKQARTHEARHPLGTISQGRFGPWVQGANVYEMRGIFLSSDFLFPLARTFACAAGSIHLRVCVGVSMS